MGYMQNCVHLKHKGTKNGEPLEILSIGGENQVNVQNDPKHENDDLIDVADIRSLKVKKSRHEAIAVHLGMP